METILTIVPIISLAVIILIFPKSQVRIADPHYLIIRIFNYFITGLGAFLYCYGLYLRVLYPEQPNEGNLALVGVMILNVLSVIVLFWPLLYLTFSLLFKNHKRPVVQYSLLILAGLLPILFILWFT